MQSWALGVQNSYEEGSRLSTLSFESTLMCGDRTTSNRSRVRARDSAKPASGGYVAAKKPTYIKKQVDPFLNHFFFFLAD